MRANYFRTLTGWELLEQRTMLAADVGLVHSAAVVDSGTSEYSVAPLLPTAQLASEASSPPNIVVFMTDDLDESSLQVMLDAGLMPNLQTYLVDQGIHFTESFVTDSKCCPSRATFLTGQYAHNHGVLTNNPPSGGASVLDDESTIATWLQSAGYQTAFVGKYLNAYGMFPASPTGQPLNPLYIPPGWDQWFATVGDSTYSVYDYEVNQNGDLVTYGDSPEDYQTDVLANLSAQIIYDIDESYAQAPLFLSVNPLAPHHEEPSEPTDQYSDLWKWRIRPAPRHNWRDAAPLGDGMSIKPPLPMGPAFNERDLSDKPASVADQPLLRRQDVIYLTRQYWDRLASLRSVDDMIGTVVQALQDTGRLNETVLIFTSDNGYFYGEHRLSQKVYPYEPSIRVPLYISTPWQEGPASSSVVVLNNDLAPTINQLAGATPDIVIDGYSWASYLETGTNSFVRRRFLIEQWAYATGEGGVVKIPSFSAVRSFAGTNRLYVEYRSENDFSSSVIDVELYNLDADPNQLQSIHNEPSAAALIAQQQQWIRLLRTSSGATVRAIETYSGGTAREYLEDTVTNSAVSKAIVSNTLLVGLEELGGDLALFPLRKTLPVAARAHLWQDANRSAGLLPAHRAPGKHRIRSHELTVPDGLTLRIEILRDKAFAEFEEENAVLTSELHEESISREEFIW